MLSRATAEHTEADALDKYAVLKLEKVEEASAALDKADGIALGNVLHKYDIARLTD